MQLATTLVHQAAMPIGVHAIRSFARYFAGSYRLEIHTDGSPDEGDEQELLRCAAGMEARIVRPAERRPLIDKRLARFPKTKALMDGAGYFAKLELPMVWDGPRFYFDSDIVWLRPASNLVPPSRPNAFSTESWSWYNGVAQDRLWIEAKTPRRVNSGFYYLGEPFPFERMEEMLEQGMFDPTIPYNTDQEIMAYLYRDMEYYHPEDLKRSRVRVRYDLATESCAALHFPGQMWRTHMDQIESLSPQAVTEPATIRYQQAVPLTKAELLRMRLSVGASNSPFLRDAINFARNARGRFFKKN